ncbi:hypothetical protein SPRG_10001 [Saprolegnia parasitica CBS 223.65]|uniref:Acyltransferase n=1 Tax=Saprolegnia parasitica (strain CBS 223.65) TaxID=695850 RepID=A0A067BY78_SAPPC|nr:hypothetical protein SPRG_10001 [Saprolegnia parasitica CBS 223.65]KDO23193.1 hypothetical protein SPRG_10001 [Saprolegnia parasitica CBS 223.65]|eukprot:XP_012206144.1 hypothetical protein SPRG_10001 [Saprolegnia parasitica CBS 223.65]
MAIPTVYVASLSAFVAGVAISLQRYELPFAILLGLLAAYVPSFFAPTQFSQRGAYWPWFATLPLWKARAPVPTTLHFESPLSKETQYLFSSHPHGPTSWHHGVMLTGASTPAFHDVIPGDRRRHLGASIVFRIPLYRELLLWLGVVDASRSVAHRVLSSGKSLVILVGGIQEQMLAEYQKHHVFLRSRKGFVKLAIQHGAAIVPVYAFGENDLFRPSTFLLPLRQWIARKFLIAIPLYVGPTWWNPLKPFPVEIHQVYGNPIQTTKCDSPSSDDVDRVHGLFLAELQRIFDTHKAAYATPDAKLEIL